MAHVADLERKAQELLAMKATLEHLVHCCHGDDRPDCPILESLATGKPLPPAGRAEGATPPRSRNRTSR